MNKNNAIKVAAADMRADWTPVYLGLFTDEADMLRRFGEPLDLLAECQVIVAAYEYEGYEGEARVYFVSKGNLYEVHAYHCSCYELEGQWSTERSNIQAVLGRRLDDQVRGVLMRYFPEVACQ